MLFQYKNCAFKLWLIIYHLANINCLISKANIIYNLNDHNNTDLCSELSLVMQPCTLVCLPFLWLCYYILLFKKRLVDAPSFWARRRGFHTVRWASVRPRKFVSFRVRSPACSVPWGKCGRRHRSVRAERVECQRSAGRKLLLFQLN